METISIEELKDTCLYMHTRKTDGRIIYIGIGNKKRPYSFDRENPHWHNIVNKYGHDVTILVENLTWKEACDLEIKMIAFYGRVKPHKKNPNYGCLVNMTDGGEGAKGNVKSKETRNKLSKALKGKKKPEGHGDKIAAYNRNRVRTKESNEKISKTMTGKLVGEKNGMFDKNHTEETKEIQRKCKIGKYDGSKNPKAKILLDVETGIYHECIKDLSQILNKNYSWFLEWLKKDKNKRYKYV
jgi:hypothetical protein